MCFRYNSRYFRYVVVHACSPRPPPRSPKYSVHLAKKNIQKNHVRHSRLLLEPFSFVTTQIDLPDAANTL